MRDEKIFTNIIVGNGNEKAVGKAEAFLTASSDKYQSLFIYGQSGLGKTLLLKEIKRYLEEEKKKHVCYVTMECLLDDLIKAMKLLVLSKESKAYELFVKMYTDVDVLIVDDVQEIKGKYATQLELCSLIDRLKAGNKWLVMASDVSIENENVFGEELRIRIQQGETCRVTYPDYEMKRNIVKTLADKKYKMANITEKEIEEMAAKAYCNFCTLEGELLALAASRNLQGKYGVEKPFV